MSVAEQKSPGHESSPSEPGRNLLEMRDEIDIDDGPGDIVFGPDFFDPRITKDHAPYSEGIQAAITAGKLVIDGRVITMDDLEKPAGELFPEAKPQELPDLMMSLLKKTEPVDPRSN